MYFHADIVELSTLISFLLTLALNIFSMLKQQLTLFQPHFIVKGQSHAGWVALSVFILTGYDLDKGIFLFVCFLFYSCVCVSCCVKFMCDMYSKCVCL